MVEILRLPMMAVAVAVLLLLVGTLVQILEEMVVTARRRQFLAAA
jgi:hypothetical protein